MHLVKYFYSLYPGRSLLTFLAITIAGAIAGLSVSALLPVLSKVISNEYQEPSYFDQIFQHIGINPTLENLITFIVIGLILKSIILAAAKIYAGFTVAKVIKDLRIKLLDAMSHAEWRFFINQPAGKLSASLLGESGKAGQGYKTSLDIFAIATQAIAYIVVAFFISWEIVILAVITSLLLWYLLKKFISKSKHLGERSTTLNRKVMSQLTDSSRSIKSLKAMARESETNSLIESNTKKLKSVAKKLTVSSQLLVAFQEIFLTLAIVFGIYYSMNMLNTSVESIIVLTILYIRILKMAGKAQKHYQSFSVAISGYNGIIESIQLAKNNQERHTGTIKYNLSNNILVKKISFSYADKTVLKDASCTIRHNKINSIIGPSGAGKTTFVDLICGLYKTQAGDIIIGSTSINDIDIHHWRKQIGYVVQENALLNSSIKENVTLNDSRFSNEKVENALSRAHALEFVRELPKGLNTIVGEGGTKLSGGQRQRILIARALVHEPNLLILDEATSALDSETEISISEIFRELSKSITIISISHRPAMIDVSDYVIKIEKKMLYQV